MNFFSVIPFLKNVFAAPVEWFSSILSSIPGSRDFIIAGFFVCLLIVVFIVPLRGGALSDRAKKVDKHHKSDK